MVPMMKTEVALELGPEVTARSEQILGAITHVRTQRARQSQLRVGSDTWPLEVGPSGHRSALPANDPEDPEGTVRIIVAERLLGRVRRKLEDAGISYADATGAVHIDIPGLLLHVQPSSRSKVGAVPAPQGLGVVAVRLIQHLLDQEQREWTVTELAAVGETSMGQAHKVLARLDSEGLIDQRRAGRSVLRRLVSPSDTLDWLARVPAARKIHDRLKTYLYATDPSALATRLAEQAHQADLAWAFSGAAAARALGVASVTALPVVMLRIDPAVALREAAARFGLEPVDSGHNVLLVADVGHLALQARHQIGPLPVAPTVRIWLDMLTETRGRDAADLFRENAIGY